MANRCINCGGTLQYDVASGKIVCEYCKSAFEPETYAKMSAEEHQKPEEEIIPEPGNDMYDANVYTCPNCGAEVSSTELAAVDYCMYCGSFVTFDSRMAKIRKPDVIIPFSKNEEDCKNIYRKNLKKRLYAPKEFRDENFISGLKGIYIPYWSYDYEYGPELKVRGSKENREGDYIVKQNYETKVQTSGKISNTVYDASSTFDDIISTGIAPFDREHMKKYSPDYMLGFYADVADIPSEVYQKESDEEIETYLWDMVTKDKEVRKGYPETDKPSHIETDFNIRKNASLAMFPVWFLTYRKGNRVAYSVVNGDTGEMYAEVPVDTKRYLLFSVLTAIPIFVLLNCLVTFNANAMLWVALLLAAFMIMFYMFELDKIVRRVMHTDDRGFLERHKEAKEASDQLVSDNFLAALGSGVIGLFKEFGIFAALGALAFMFFASEYVLIGLVILFVVTPIYTVYRLVKNVKLLKDKTVYLDLLGALFSILFGLIMLVADPAADMFYYVAAILCMAGVGFTAVRMMRRQNELITRPLPHFFDRKRGGAR